VVIYFKIIIDNNEIEMNISKHNINLNFNKVNWKKFSKILTEKCNLKLPNNKNLNKRTQK